MNENLLFTVNMVVPLFAIMAFGDIVQRKKWLPESCADVFDKFCADQDRL